MIHTYTKIAYEKKKKNENLQSKLDDEEKTEDIKVTTDEFRGQSLRSSSL